MHRRLCLLLLLSTMILPGAARAQTDTPASLRQQITQLAREIETLRAELEALRAEHKGLLAENESLRRALTDRDQPTTASKTGTETASAPAGPSLSASLSREPLASPEAMFVALVLDYREHMGETIITDEASENDLRQSVRTWTRTVGERFSGQTDWLTRLRLLDQEEGKNERTAVVTILDPATLASISAPFPVEVPVKFHARMDNAINPSGGDESGAAQRLLWKLRVQMDAEPVHQPGRLSPGPFDFPRFIGPFAGFGRSVKILGIGPITLEDAKKAMVESDAGKPPVER